MARLCDEIRDGGLGWFTSAAASGGMDHRMAALPTSPFALLGETVERCLVDYDGRACRGCRVETYRRCASVEVARSWPQAASHDSIRWLLGILRQAQQMVSCERRCPSTQITSSEHPTLPSTLLDLIVATAFRTFTSPGLCAAVVARGISVRTCTFRLVLWELTALLEGQTRRSHIPPWGSFPNRSANLSRSTANNECSDESCAWRVEAHKGSWTLAGAPRAAPVMSGALHRGGRGCLRLALNCVARRCLWQLASSLLSNL